MDRLAIVRIYIYRVNSNYNKQVILATNQRMHIYAHFASRYPSIYSERKGFAGFQIDLTYFMQSWEESRVIAEESNTLLFSIDSLWRWSSFAGYVIRSNRTGGRRSSAIWMNKQKEQSEMDNYMISYCMYIDISIDCNNIPFLLLPLLLYRRCWSCHSLIWLRRL